MLYKNIYLFFFIFIFLTNCSVDNLSNKRPISKNKNFYVNKGFALIYNNKKKKKKIVTNPLDERSLTIFQKNLKKGTQIKVTNIFNNKSLLAIVGKKAKYPAFNNSVISLRIASELNLDLAEPYIEIKEIKNNSLFVANSAKTYDEERKVATKVPVKDISINNLNEENIDKKNKKKIVKKFIYTIKVADFYFYDTATEMINRINKDTNNTDAKIKKISNKKYRVYLGPFSDINSLQKSFNDINILMFENIEIIKND